MKSKDSLFYVVPNPFERPARDPVSIRGAPRRAELRPVKFLAGCGTFFGAGDQ